MSKLFLSSCGGECWARQINSDDDLRKAVSEELFGVVPTDPDEMAEVQAVIEMLNEDEGASFEDGRLSLIPGGIYKDSEKDSRE